MNVVVRTLFVNQDHNQSAAHAVNYYALVSIKKTLVQSSNVNVQLHVKKVTNKLSKWKVNVQNTNVVKKKKHHPLQPHLNQHQLLLAVNVLLRTVIFINLTKVGKTVIMLVSLILALKIKLKNVFQI
jgi:hypothetical protein